MRLGKEVLCQKERILPLVSEMGENSLPPSTHTNTHNTHPSHIPHLVCVVPSLPHSPLQLPSSPLPVCACLTRPRMCHERLRSVHSRSVLSPLSHSTKTRWHALWFFVLLLLSPQFDFTSVCMCVPARRNDREGFLTPTPKKKKEKKPNQTKSPNKTMAESILCASL